METSNIQEDDIKALLALNEDHFNDVKSKRIAPAKLQETFVAFANSDGGDLYRINRIWGSALSDSANQKKRTR